MEESDLISEDEKERRGPAAAVLPYSRSQYWKEEEAIRSWWS
jgi:hypothetical protein